MLFWGIHTLEEFWDAFFGGPYSGVHWGLSEGHVVPGIMPRPPAGKVCLFKYALSSLPGLLGSLAEPLRGTWGTGESSPFHGGLGKSCWEVPWPLMPHLLSPHRAPKALRLA